jgi:hypothetical protein
MYVEREKKKIPIYLTKDFSNFILFIKKKTLKDWNVAPGKKEIDDTKKKNKKFNFFYFPLKERLP